MSKVIEDGGFTPKSLFNFSDVESKNASPTTLNLIIREVLRSDNGVCYSMMERYLMPPGTSGSRSFDQSEAVNVLLTHDVNLDGRITKIMAATGMSRRIVWDRLQAVLRNVGFQIKHGRLIGVLENKSEVKNGDDGQPDID